MSNTNNNDNSNGNNNKQTNIAAPGMLSNSEKGGGGSEKDQIWNSWIKVTLGGGEFFSRSFSSQHFLIFKFILLHFQLKIHRFFLNFQFDYN